MKKGKLYNIAYIDGQNLRLGTLYSGRKIDLTKFRIYLRDKYNVHEAHYFLGFVTNEEQDLYDAIQKAGFILNFREHSSALKGKKKGNVDVDIVFAIMRRLKDHDDFDKIVIVSGDGDYIKLVKYLIEQNRLCKILFPNGYYSSLYKRIKYTYGINLSVPDIQVKIIHSKTKKKSS